MKFGDIDATEDVHSTFDMAQSAVLCIKILNYA